MYFTTHLPPCHFCFLSSVKLTNFSFQVSSRYQCDHICFVWLHCQFETTVATGGRFQTGHQFHHEECRWCPSHLLFTRSFDLTHPYKRLHYPTFLQNNFFREAQRHKNDLLTKYYDKKKNEYVINLWNILHTKQIMVYLKLAWTTLSQ